MLGLPFLCLATGKGPVGVWPVTSELVLFVDKNVNELILTDLNVGGALGRLAFEGDPRLAAPATCLTCDFVIVVGNGYTSLGYEKVREEDGTPNLFQVALSEPLASSADPGSTLVAGSIKAWPNPTHPDGSGQSSHAVLNPHMHDDDASGWYRVLLNR